jgi:hypothetical protein
MKKIIIITCLLWLQSVLLYAQQTDTTLVKTDTLPKYGSLKVVVIDSDTEEPLPGALVIPQGFGDTITTDINGICYFRNIVPGNYRIKTHFHGYHSLLTGNCEIENANQVNIVVKLKSKPWDKTFGLIDHKPMVFPDKTSSYHIYTAEEIKRYPSKP